MKRIRHQLRLVVYLINYLQGSIIHPRWLFGISSINRKWLSCVSRSVASLALLFRLSVAQRRHWSPPALICRTCFLNRSHQLKCVSFTKCHVQEKSHFKTAGETSQQKTRKPIAFSFSSMICRTLPKKHSFPTKKTWTAWKPTKRPVQFRQTSKAFFAQDLANLVHSPFSLGNEVVLLMGWKSCTITTLRCIKPWKVMG